MMIRTYLNVVSGVAVLFSCIGFGSAHAGLLALGAPEAGPQQVMSLYAINACTGDPTEIGSTGVAGLQGLAVHPVTGELFAAGGYDEASAAGLYQIDPNTGTATYIGGTGNFISLDFSPEGVLYGVGALGNSDDGVGDDLYTIDLATGSPTLVEFLSGFCCKGIAFLPGGETIVYAWGGTQLSTIDVESGVFTYVSPVGGGSVRRLAASSDGTVYNATTSLFTLDISPPASVTLVGDTGIDITGLTYRDELGPGDDADLDGIPDGQDNCCAVANADQRDTNGDGFGNACDADLSNDCAINAIDLGLIKSVFFSTDEDADFDGDGGVNFFDLGIMKASFFTTPGPSGVPNICN